MSIHFFAKRASTPAATAAFVVWGLLGVAAPAAAQVQTAVEYGFYSYWDDCYYYSTNNGRTLVCDYRSYFVTSSPDEMAALDGGAFDLFGGPVCLAAHRRDIRRLERLRKRRASDLPLLQTGVLSRARIHAV